MRLGLALAWLVFLELKYGPLSLWLQRSQMDSLLPDILQLSASEIWKEDTSLAKGFVDEHVLKFAEPWEFPLGLEAGQQGAQLELYSL